MLNLNLLVLRALLSKKGWWALAGLVQVDTFEATEYRQLHKLLSMLHESTETDLLPETLAAAVESTYINSEEQCGKLLAMVQLLEETPELPEDQLLVSVKQFLQRSISYQIAEHIAQNVEQADFDAGPVAELAARAVAVSDRVGATVVDLFEQGISGAPDSRPVRNGLGFSRKLDAGLRGGVGAGELCVYLAPPATGKTSLLVCSGAAHAAAGGTVLHITLEINTRKVVERYDQWWTGKSQAEIETPDGQQAVQAARRIVKAAGGEVFIADWSYMPVTANDVGSLVRKMRGQGRNVSLVVIDYLGLMSPATKTSGKGEMRQSFSSVGKETRSLARNLNLPVLTAWQVNREGSKSEFLQASDIAESWDIVMIADMILGLNQTAAMRDNKRMRVNIIKQREATERSDVLLYCDLDRMVVRDVTAEDHFASVRAIMGEDAPGTGGGEAGSQGAEGDAAALPADRPGGEGAPVRADGESQEGADLLGSQPRPAG